MTPQRWSQIRALFNGALERPPEARAAWLQAECGSDAALLAEAERLLRSFDTLGGFLDEPAHVDPADLALAAPPAEGDRPTAPEGADWPPGRRVGDYEIVGTLGRGGMGVVYLATDLRLDRRVALKVLSPEMQLVDKGPQLSEARTAARITHPAVAVLYEAGQLDGRHVLASEYVPGRSLRQLLEQGPIDAVAARAIAADVARGLDAAHAAGVLHRDLKPENIIVTEGGHAKIVDFGIARLFDPDSPVIVSGVIRGTPAYMAPEQLLEGRTSPSSDFYALGVVLEEMLTGRHPLAAPAEQPLPGDTFVQKLRAVADRARQPDPQRRFSRASEMVAALEAISGHESPTAVEPRALPSAGGPNRWWWEFHQVAAAVSYAAMLIPAWMAREQIGGLEGRGFFIATAVAALVASMLRLHLWFTSRQHASELAWARRRSAPFIRLADILLVVSLVIGAGLVAAQSVLDVVLLVLAVGVAVAFAFIEPSTARAAGLDGLHDKRHI
jgi:serine/threonine protein kinase